MKNKKTIWLRLPFENHAWAPRTDKNGSNGVSKTWRCCKNGFQSKSDCSQKNKLLLLRWCVVYNKRKRLCSYRGSQRY